MYTALMFIWIIHIFGTLAFLAIGIYRLVDGYDVDERMTGIQMIKCSLFWEIHLCSFIRDQIQETREEKYNELKRKAELVDGDTETHDIFGLPRHGRRAKTVIPKYEQERTIQHEMWRENCAKAKKLRDEAMTYLPNSTERNQLLAEATQLEQDW